MRKVFLILLIVLLEFSPVKAKKKILSEESGMLIALCGVMFKDEMPNYTFLNNFTEPLAMFAEPVGQCALYQNNKVDFSNTESITYFYKNTGGLIGHQWICSEKENFDNLEQEFETPTLKMLETNLDLNNTKVQYYYIKNRSKTHRIIKTTFVCVQAQDTIINTENINFETNLYIDSEDINFNYVQSDMTIVHQNVKNLISSLKLLPEEGTVSHEGCHCGGNGKAEG